MQIPVVTILPVERSFISSDHEGIAAAAEHFVVGLLRHGASVDDVRLVGAKLSPDPSRWAETRERYKMELLDRDMFLRIESEVSFDLTVFDKIENMNTQRRVAFAEIHAASLLRKMAGDLAIVGNLAHPGRISFNRGIVLVRDEVTTLPRLSGGLFGMARHHAMERGWPSFVDVSFNEVYQWFISIPGVRAGAPQGPVGRAVCAMSHLLTDYSRLNLVWAVMALEALYCTDNQNLTNQLVERSGILLGRPATFQKQVSQMYNFRSRLVHGSMDFPLDYYEEAREFAADDYEKGGQDSEMVAVSVLTATLQRIAKADGAGLSFSTQVAIPTLSRGSAS